MKNQPVVIPPSTEANPDHTEALLQGLIAECHQIIRDVVVPAAQGAGTDSDRRYYLNSVVDLVRIANASGDTVARLRGGVHQELRQRITVERIERRAGNALPQG
jgi:hypothetical protein